MSVMTLRRAEPPAWLGTIFDRIVCGVDGTESSRAAVVQANRLLAARRTLELVSVVEETSEAWSRAPPPRRTSTVSAKRLWPALRKGRDQCPRARTALLFGDPGPKLVSAAREVDATLVVIGAPASGRLGAFVLGGAGSYVLHNAPCSVLIARHAADEDAFPRSIVVGHDGSPAATEAAIVAEEIALRFGAALRIVVATGGDSLRSTRCRRSRNSTGPGHGPSTRSKTRPTGPTCSSSAARAFGAPALSAASVRGSATSHAARCSSFDSRHGAPVWSPRLRTRFRTPSAEVAGTPMHATRAVPLDVWRRHAFIRGILLAPVAALTYFPVNA